jgi:molecular chaperone HscC
MIVGIDLGTSNSLVAVWRDGTHMLIPNALGHVLTPSVVSMLDNGDIVVGEAARDRLMTHPQRTAAAFKRYMGSDHMLRLGGRGFRPEELSALVLRQLKEDAETFLGARVDEAVITVPAYFSDAQRKATKAAGQIAGLRVERLLNEPTAAALAYGLDSMRGSGEDARILVVDLGGGTFDVSILELFHGVMEVRATAGDNYLGGEDFVDAIVDAFVAEVGAAAGIPPRTDLRAAGFVAPHPTHALLRRQAELAKRALSEAPQTTITVTHEGAPVSWTLSQERFAQLAEKLLQRLRQPLARAVRDARLRPDELTQIVMAGGATRMPDVRRMVARLFGRLPSQSINPDEVVARGAAVQAGLKARDAALDEVVLTDVSPFTLGIEISRMGADKIRQSGLFSPILERNTVIPASRVETFSTASDNQNAIDVAIYQGEARLVKDNIRLGAIEVRVPRAKAGQEKIDVRFTYDVSGLLEVEVTVVSTGEKVQKIIEGNPGVLTAEQIEIRRRELAGLKVHPREEAANIAVLARAERMYEESLGFEREQIGRWIDAFRGTVESQDRRAIDHARDTLARQIEGIFDQPFDL